MIGWRHTKAGEARNDIYLRAFLRHHDPVPPQNAAQLSILESCILSRLDAAPSAVPADFMFPFLMAGRQWVLRGACLVAVLSIMLGFVAGRGFYELSSQSADQTALFTPAGAAPWQSFIDAPAAAGETYDAAE